MLCIFVKYHGELFFFRVCLEISSSFPSLLLAEGIETNQDKISLDARE